MHSQQFMVFLFSGVFFSWTIINDMRIFTIALLFDFTERTILVILISLMLFSLALPSFLASSRIRVLFNHHSCDFLTFKDIGVYPIYPHLLEGFRSNPEEIWRSGSRLNSYGHHFSQSYICFLPLKSLLLRLIRRRRFCNSIHRDFAADSFKLKQKNIVSRKYIKYNIGFRYFNYNMR